MRQIRDMLTSVQPQNPLVVTLHRAEKLLRRGIVEQSLTLGFNPIAEEGVDGAYDVDAPVTIVEDGSDELDESTDAPPDDDVETAEDAASTM